MAATAKEDTGDDTLDELLKDTSRVEELSSDEEAVFRRGTNDATTPEINGVPFPGKGHQPAPKRRLADADLPPWLRTSTLALPLYHPAFQTTTSESQHKTIAECLPLLTGQDTQTLPLNTHGLPALRRTQHAAFLASTFNPLPAPYVVVDASRPWLFYWTLAGLGALAQPTTPYRDRLISTVRPLQNPTGGFGGGHGQLSHCACTYATVLALACAGGLRCVDRAAMWRWLGTVKQADGGFRMAVGAEEDIRGAYCAMTILTLLDLPLALPPDAPARAAGLATFTDRLGEWVGSCQTYEGGISGAPNNEAHGAYAFCALACLSILDAPSESIPRYLDVDALVRWLASMQTQPEGGFAGRTEKLVDACYSHWVGGCWALLQAAVPPPNRRSPSTPPSSAAGEVSERDLWSREALIRYLLTCSQQPGAKGGMRDKPSTRPDGYHTCYSLAGLSAAQNRYSYDFAGETVDAGGRLVAAFNWSVTGPSEAELEAWGCDGADVVGGVHPVFVVPMAVVERTRGMFEGLGGLS
ncbi:hypothetical protein LTR08_004157 [Meristemomyces frigidus]|nr:hypothetical protein LTR08_004157 [Meristemomyces frigidus]